MQEFVENIFRYPRYLIALILGIFWNAIAPLVPLMKRPATAIAVIGLALGGLSFLTFTLRAMLGLSNI